MYCISFKSCL